jgi:hypothetical protein
VLFADEAVFRVVVAVAVTAGIGGSLAESGWVADCADGAARLATVTAPFFIVVSVGSWDFASGAVLGAFAVTAAGTLLSEVSFSRFSAILGLETPLASACANRRFAAV